MGLLTWAEQLAKGDGLFWAIEDRRHLSRRLERDLLAASQSIVRVPEVDGPRARLGTDSPIPLMRMPSRGPHSASPTFPRPGWMALTATCGCSVIIVKPLSLNGLGSFVGCGGTCTSSTGPGNRRPERWIGSATLELAAAHLNPFTGTVACLARGLVERNRELTQQVNQLTAEITTLVSSMATIIDRDSRLRSDHRGQDPR